ncbi:MAG: DUF6174 domain-containing protein [Isosphaeraceae bacterium]
MGQIFRRQVVKPSCSWVLILLTLPGCGSGVAVTAESLEQARARWKRAGVADYDLEWRTSGTNRADYEVKVRKGQVQSVEAVAPDGRRFPLKPAEPRFYSVDGLFLTIADELAQLDQPTPFGRPKGSSTILRFDPDPSYGYPRSYRRDVVGAPSSLTIEVVRFRPVTVTAPAPAR